LHFSQKYNFILIEKLNILSYINFLFKNSDIEIKNISLNKKLKLEMKKLLLLMPFIIFLIINILIIY